MSEQRYTLIKNARLITLPSQSPENCSILIQNKSADSPVSRIIKIGEVDEKAIHPSALTVFNARSHYVCRGFIDLGTHTCEPGYMHRETLKSASDAARKGGFTSILTATDTSPSPDSELVIDYIKSNSPLCRCGILPGVSLSINDEYLQMSDIVSLMSRGGAAVRCSGLVPDGMLFEAMCICRDKGYPLIIKCSEAYADGHGELPLYKQDIATARALILSSETGCPVHITCVSSARSVELIRQAKANGVRVTADTCPQYFIFSKEDILFYGTNLKLMPPLGSFEDKEALLCAIEDGTIDCISSDHTPCDSDDKEMPFDRAARGMIGLQTLFSASYTHLVSTGVISLSRLVEMLTVNPAKVLGLDAQLTKGSVADITVFSASAEVCVTKENNRSRSQNSPFFGQFLSGDVIHTFVNGK